MIYRTNKIYVAPTWATEIEVDFRTLDAIDLKAHGDGTWTVSNDVTFNISGMSNCSSCNVVPGTGIVFTISSTGAYAYVFFNLYSATWSAPSLLYFPRGEELEVSCAISQTTPTVNDEILTLRIPTRDWSDGVSTGSMIEMDKLYVGSRVVRTSYQDPGNSRVYYDVGNANYQILQVNITAQTFTTKEALVFDANWESNLVTHLVHTSSNTTRNYGTTGLGTDINIFYGTGSSSCAGRTITIPYLRVRRKKPR